MKKLYLICDESGAKGFSDNKEQSHGEFGIFAGYLIDESKIENSKIELKVIYDKYSTGDGKIHITDLESSLQENLRTEVFDWLEKNDISCAYEAISVQGFNSAYESLNAIKEVQVSSLSQKYSFSKNLDLDRLHSELFQGLFGKAIAFFIEKYGEENINITVVTDKIDDKIKKEFMTKAKEIINPLLKDIKVKAFDKFKNIPVVKNIKFKSEQINNDNISKTNFEIIVEDNELTLIADIIANSLLYYIKQEIENNPDINLNSSIAIKNHPLLNLFYGLSEKRNANIVSDVIFKRKTK